MHALSAPPHLVGQRFGTHGQGICIGHFKNSRNPAHDRGARARFEIFFVNSAGLSKMHLRVDNSGQDMQTGAINALMRAGMIEIANGGNPPVPQADVAALFAVMIDQSAVGQNAIECLQHGEPLV